MMGGRTKRSTDSRTYSSTFDSIARLPNHTPHPRTISTRARRRGGDGGHVFPVQTSLCVVGIRVKQGVCVVLSSFSSSFPNPRLPLLPHWRCQYCPSVRARSRLASRRRPTARAAAPPWCLLLLPFLCFAAVLGGRMNVRWERRRASRQGGPLGLVSRRPVRVGKGKAGRHGHEQTIAVYQHQAVRVPVWDGLCGVHTRRFNA